jgi:hypothetical protein
MIEKYVKRIGYDVQDVPRKVLLRNINHYIVVVGGKGGN